ncbi:MAG: VCBS repeat-containing protein, partial [Planctomycetes bacterium]|nr:VCBS repeat-containing protein [Planctomycetota bacterium]
MVLLALAAAGAAGSWYLLSGSANSAGTGRVTTQRATTVWFEEVAEQSGLTFRHVRTPVVRYWLPEIMSGGAGLFDYDNDGDMDLYLVQAGDLDPTATDKPGNRLYRNRGDGTFDDVTAAAGVADTGYGDGCACGDYDGDGDVDLYVTNVGPNALYRNNGDGTFTDVTAAAGVGDPGWGCSAAFFDYDADGDLDLMVVNYVIWSIQAEIKCAIITGEQDYCSPSNYNAPAPDTLYRNEGDGTFVEVSEAAGLRAAYGNGLGICCGDYNLDGRLDIYVANDASPNQLWHNTGRGGFRDDALLAGCSVNANGTTEAGMGVAGVDLDNDGDLDLFMTHLRNETHTLYLNHGAF